MEGRSPSSTAMYFRLSSLLLVIAIAIALWQWLVMPQPRGRLFDVLGILIMLAFVTEIVGGATNMVVLNNAILYNTFNILESYLLLWIMSIYRPGWKVLFQILAVFITGVFAANYLINSNNIELLTEAILVNAVMISILCLILLWGLAQKSVSPLANVPVFWLFIGTLTYFAGMVPLIGVHKFIALENYPIASMLYKIIPSLAIIRYLLTAFACRLATRSATRHANG